MKEHVGAETVQQVVINLRDDSDDSLNEEEGDEELQDRLYCYNTLTSVL